MNTGVDKQKNGYQELKNKLSAIQTYRVHI